MGAQLPPRAALQLAAPIADKLKGAAGRRCGSTWARRRRGPAGRGRGVALGVAKRECAGPSSASSGGTRFRDCAATNALDPAALLESGTVPKTFLMTSSARLLPHALPTRLCAHSFLNTMSKFAQDELAFGGVQRWLPRAQHSAALRSICRSVVDNSDGVNVWASWVLLVFMISDARIRHLISASPISDLEVAAALVFTAYGRAEVTHRARLEEKVEAARASKQPKLEEEEEEGAPLDYEDDVNEAGQRFMEEEPAASAEAAAEAAVSGGNDHHSPLSAKRKRSGGGGLGGGLGGEAAAAAAASRRSCRPTARRFSSTGTPPSAPSTRPCSRR